ncbi:PREDICTED: transmembrane protein 216-like [Nicrophorus vespilloides]|uniref:Transmembrane protein 216-like n=1 Tax=Nicrophorus vespilloides TaxID=110193 RepID=A0ABM1M392_NICVS|nr:PREDICTED: transmembrane protein 216-like [Nicrophorus vespilloides]
MNVGLTFEVLLYLNSYYFGLFAVCEIGINVVKAINQPLPSFGTDLGILLGVCVLEVFRVIIARKGNLTEKWWSVFAALLFTVPSALGVVYFLLWQSFVIRFEYIMCAIQLTLQAMEIFFGILVLLPICKTPEYY